jgi:hypothetical protein
MTIRIQHLTIDHDAAAWTMDLVRRGLATDCTMTTSPQDMLSMVRHIMRERGDCTMVPVVRSVVRFSEVNEWGNNGEVEVTYHTKGYRAIYGFHAGEAISLVQCYMD